MQLLYETTKPQHHWGFVMSHRGEIIPTQSFPVAWT